MLPENIPEDEVRHHGGGNTSAAPKKHLRSTASDLAQRFNRILDTDAHQSTQPSTPSTSAMDESIQKEVRARGGSIESGDVPNTQGPLAPSKPMHRPGGIYTGVAKPLALSTKTLSHLMMEDADRMLIWKVSVGVQ